MGRPRLHPQLYDADWLRARYYDDGMDQAEIAHLIGCTQQAVSRAMVSQGMAIRPHVTDGRRVRRMMRLIEEGATIRQAALQAGVPVGTAYRLVEGHRDGLRRPRGGRYDERLPLLRALVEDGATVAEAARLTRIPGDYAYQLLAR